VVTGKVVARAHGGQTVIRMTAQDGRSVVAMAEARVAPL